MQEQTQNDKMVPIDTSGDPVEVELKEEGKKEEKVTEPEIQVEEEPKQEGKEEELEEYSQSVKRRIDKLTRKMREAERREQAAIEYAKKVQEENKNLNVMSQATSKERVASDEQSLQSTEQLLKTAYTQAVSEGDVEKQMEAQQRIAQLASEKERLSLRKRKVEQQEIQKEQPVEDPWNNQQQAQPQAQAPTRPDPKAQDWAEDNKWFGSDKAMTYTAMSFHDELINEGFDASSEEYYTEIDRRIRKEFPHKFEDQSKPKQKVASATRTTATGRRTVKLTPSQVAIAKKLGVPLEEYATHVKEA